MRTLIRNGTLLNGLGQTPFKADLAIEGDRILAIHEDLSHVHAERVIDADNCLVTPGFIDVHTHSDAYILIEPEAPSKLYQGVTTEIGGNCGTSCAPLAGEARLPADWEAHTFPGGWQTVADYRELLSKVRPAPNIALLVGHNTLRAGVLGYTSRKASADHLKTMTHRLEQALNEGARGLSTGLVYSPGCYADTDEIIALAATAARHGTLLTTHLRSETRRLIPALEEALHIGRETGVAVQVSHLKASGRDNHPLLETALTLIEEARAAGLDVSADRYPYTASCTDLDIVFPKWASEGGRETIRERLRNPVVRQRLQDELARKRRDEEWDEITVGSTAHPDNLAFQGQPLTSVAKALNMHPSEALLYLVESDDLRTSAFFHGMSETNMHRVLQRPWVMIASDASLRSPIGPLSHDWPHPRAYGTFTRFLCMALTYQTVSLPEAIHKMTALPAKTFDLKQRGILQEGYAADVLVIDPESLQENTSFAKPHALSTGIQHMFVNGVHTLRNGKLSGERGGCFL